MRISEFENTLNYFENILIVDLQDCRFAEICKSFNCKICTRFAEMEVIQSFNFLKK